MYLVFIGICNGRIESMYTLYKCQNVLYQSFWDIYNYTNVD